jgi:threonine dehydratase
MCLGSPVDLHVSTFDDVRAAAGRIAGVAHRTPVLHSRLLDELLGAEVFFKCENLQRAGAFKFRGAFNALSRLTPAQRQAGVMAYSSGNHAQAVALAGSLLGIPATILMPHDAAAGKVEATARYGGRIVRYDRYREDRQALSATLADEGGLTLVPPFDHPDVLAGQGTVAKELLEEVGDLDALFVPLGGGGLLSGSILSARALSPGCAVYGVEPEAGDDGRQSLRAGHIVTIGTPTTIADGAQTQSLGRYPFEIIRGGAADVLAVPDADLVEGMRLVARYLKLIVEPTGCLGLAGLRAQKARNPKTRVGVILSGGNIEPEGFAALVG